MLRIGWCLKAMNSKMTVGGDVGKVRSGAKSRILMSDPAVVFEKGEVLWGANVKASSDGDCAFPAT